MKKLGENIQKKTKKIIYYLIIFGLFYFIYSTYRTILKFKASAGRVEEARLEVEKLQRESAELDKKLEEAQNIEFIEREIRDKLGMVKEGEIVVIMPPPDVVRKYALKAPTELQEPKETNWKKWIQLFF